MSKNTLPVIQEYGLTKYMDEISKFPVLEEKEEYMLAVRYKEHGDVNAAHKLVTSHLRLVVKMAMKFRGYGLPMNDVISEGNIGLMTAVKKFEPSKGFRLSTYAMWWIKASINEFVLKSWSIVKVGTSAAQKKLFYNLKRLKNQLSDDKSSSILSDSTADLIAENLDVTAAEVKDMDNLMMGGLGSSLNVNMYEEGDGDKIDFVEDESANQEVVLGNQEEFDHNSSLLSEAMKNLTDREKDILKKRRLRENPLTLEDISQQYGVSRERVRQIENRAFEKLQSFIVPLARKAATA